MKMPDLFILLGGWNGGNKASPLTLCFPRFASFTNSDLWFPEEGGEQLAVEMEEVILRLIRNVNMVDNKALSDLMQIIA